MKCEELYSIQVEFKWCGYGRDGAKEASDGLTSRGGGPSVVYINRYPMPAHADYGGSPSALKSRKERERGRDGDRETEKRRPNTQQFRVRRGRRGPAAKRMEQGSQLPLPPSGDDDDGMGKGTGQNDDMLVPAGELLACSPAAASVNKPPPPPPGPLTPSRSSLRAGGQQASTWGRWWPVVADAGEAATSDAWRGAPQMDGAGAGAGAGAHRSCSKLHPSHHKV